jgi:hypothetical protein
MKQCTKFQVSSISYVGGEVSIGYFILSTSLGPTMIQRKSLNPPAPKIFTSTDGNEALYEIITEK